MVLKLEIETIGMIDQVALRKKIFDTIAAMITAGTLLATSDVGSIGQFHTVVEE